MAGLPKYILDRLVVALTDEKIAHDFKDFLDSLDDASAAAAAEAAAVAAQASANAAQSDANDAAADAAAALAAVDAKFQWPDNYYIVGPSQTYSTVQSAINAAKLDGALVSNPKTVVILDNGSSYNESLILWPGVRMVGLGSTPTWENRGEEFHTGPVISGKNHSVNPSFSGIADGNNGLIHISNLTFFNETISAASDELFDLNIEGVHLKVEGCSIHTFCTVTPDQNSRMFRNAATNVTFDSFLDIIDCKLHTVDVPVMDNPLLPISQDDGAHVRFVNCNLKIDSGFGLSLFLGSADFYNCNILGASNGGDNFVLPNNGIIYMRNCSIVMGSIGSGNDIFNIQASATVNLVNCAIHSEASGYIARGTGIFNYGQVTFEALADVQNTLSVGALAEVPNSVP